MRVDKPSAILGGFVAQIVLAVVAMFTDLSWLIMSHGGLFITCILLATAEEGRA